MCKRRRIFEIIQVGSDNDQKNKIFDFVLVAAIVINLFIALFSTFEESAKYEKTLYFIELVTVVFFTAEFALRLWTADVLYPKKKGRYRAALAFFFSPSGLVDFLAFSPFYFPPCLAIWSCCIPYFQSHKDIQTFQGHKISRLTECDH